MLLGSVIVSATAWWRYNAGDRELEPLLTVTGLLIAASFLLFAAIIGMTFRRSSQQVTTTAVPTLRVAQRR